MKIFLLLSFVLLLQGACSREHAIVVPKAFRTGATESVAVNLHGYPVGTEVRGYLQELPGLQKIFSRENGVLNNVDEPVLLPMTVQARDILPFRSDQKVRLSISIKNEKPITIDVHVSQESGYLFATTDRPTYKPGELVQYKIFPLKQTMRPDNTIVTITIRTPDGIGVDRNMRALEQGDSFIEDDFRLSPFPELGLWIVEAAYSANGYNTSAETKFKVDHYVLPTFQVKIDLPKKYVLVGDTNITGTIKAHYSYGKAVDGNFFLAAKIKKSPSSEPIEFHRFPGGDFVWASISDGERPVTIPLSNLQQTTGDTIETLERNKAVISLEVSVNGKADGVIESAISHELRITKSPYVIDTTRTSPYFTPGLPYIIQVDVLHSFGREPAQGVRVTISANGQIYNAVSEEHGLINYQLDLDSNGAQNVIVTTNVPRLERQQQATATISLTPYDSPSNNYLQIRSTSTYVNVGNSNWQVTFSFSDLKKKIIRYFIMSRGTIVAWGNKEARRNRGTVTANINIIQAMVPSARLVAYYLVGKEIVANSLWFDVVNQCETPLSLSVPEEVSPGDRVLIEISGPSNAVVSLSGVDRAAYFLYNGSRLLPKNMFDKMESYDQGCIRNGGRNARSVFLEAGFNIVNTITSPAVDVGCNTPTTSKRKKRDAANDANTFLAAKLEKCIFDGKHKGVYPNDTCADRAQRVKEFLEEFPECAIKFKQSCDKETRKRYVGDILRKLGRKSNPDAAAEAEAQLAKLRADFSENMVFDDITLSNEGKATYRGLATDSITTFEIDAVSVKDVDDGFCVAQTANVRVFKTIFIQLYTPYSLRIHEQANLRITAFNYDKTVPKTVKLQIYIDKDEPLCTYYNRGEWNELIVFNVPPQDAKSTIFTILPLKIPTGNGKVSVQVRAVDSNDNILDYVKHEILIEDSGELLDSVGSKAIDLSSNSEQNFNLTFNFPEDFVPGTRKCWLYGYVNFLGPSIEVDPLTKEPKDISKIFRMPSGCGEQTMLTSGPNVYTLMYLVAANKITRGSADYLKATAKIKNGFERELVYRSTRVNPKVFAVWASALPSTWLNAFVDKVFMKATNYTDIDTVPLCDSLKWLVTKQHTDGYFVEDQKPYHKEMHGAVGGKLSLTAYVVISMKESTETTSRCSQETNNLVNAAVERAVIYLNNNIENPIFHNRPYAIALLSYAFALVNPGSTNAEKMFRRLLGIKTQVDDTFYWRGRTENIGGTDLHPYWYNRPNAIDVEATAYALLAQIAMAKNDNPPSQTDIDRARKTVLWLIGKRNEGGAFISTQDTVMGLQALAQYEVWTDSLDISPKINDFTLSFTAPNTTWTEENAGNSMHLTDEQLKYRTEIEVPQKVINHGSVDVSAAGVGEGVVSYRCVYRSVIDDEPCHFNINHTVQILGEELSEENTRIKLTLTISKTYGPASGMTIIEVGLMSGFVPDEQSLKRLSRELAVDGIIDRYEITNFNVVLYVSEITNKTLGLSFEMKQTVFVAKPEPAKINVYDYSEPFVRCGFFYNLPLGGVTANLRTTNCDRNNKRNNLCKCAEGGCVTCRTRDQQLNDTKCMKGGNCSTCQPNVECLNVYKEFCERNYAYVVNITGVHIPSDDSVFYTLTAKVIKILKFGDHSVNESEEIKFIVRKDCYKNCYDPMLNKDGVNNQEYFKINRILLISGSEPDVVLGRNNKKVHQYRLNDNAFVESYIPKTKCKKWTKKYDRCKSYYDDTENLTGVKKTRCDNFKHRPNVPICNNYADIEDILDKSACEFISG